MTGGLRALWEWGFELDGRRHPWGTLAEQVPDLAPGPGEEHGLPAIHRVAHHAAAGPVTGISLQLGAYDVGPLRARLDAELGPGEHVPKEHGPERSNSRWRLAGATVRLVEYPSDWGFDWGRSRGRLDVSVDLDRVAEPYLTRFRGLGEPYMEGPGEAETFPAPGLVDLCRAPFSRDAVRLALGRPELRATPAWVAERLDEVGVAVWRHPPSGTFGVATRCCTWPCPRELRHIRWAAARGSGYATLDGRGDPFLSTAPGPAGLDDVAARLSALGVAIERIEETDWG